MTANYRGEDSQRSHLLTSQPKHLPVRQSREAGWIEERRGGRRANQSGQKKKKKTDPNCSLTFFFGWMLSNIWHSIVDHEFTVNFAFQVSQGRSGCVKVWMYFADIPLAMRGNVMFLFLFLWRTPMNSMGCLRCVHSVLPENQCICINDHAEDHCGVSLDNKQANKHKQLVIILFKCQRCLCEEKLCRNRVFLWVESDWLIRSLIIFSMSDFDCKTTGLDSHCRWIG